MERLCKVDVWFCGAEREIGRFPSSVFNDVKTVLLYIKRGKRSKLSPQRLDAVDTALKACAFVPQICVCMFVCLCLCVCVPVYVCLCGDKQTNKQKA